MKKSNVIQYKKLKVHILFKDEMKGKFSCNEKCWKDAVLNLLWGENVV